MSTSVHAGRQPAEISCIPTPARIGLGSIEAAVAEVIDLLGSFGIRCERLSRIGEHRYALTVPLSADRVRAASAALRSGGQAGVSALPALSEVQPC